MADLTRDHTARGFLFHEGLDRYDKPYSIQNSSLASEDCIWLGSDHATGFDADRIGTVLEHDDKGALLIPAGVTRVSTTCRMHLTKNMAAELIPLLQHFVDNGELP